MTTTTKKNAFDFTYEALVDAHVNGTNQISTRVYQGYVRIDKETNQGENVAGTETVLRYLKKIGAIEDFKLNNIEENIDLETGKKRYIYKIDIKGLNIKTEVNGKFGKYSIFYKAIKNMLGYKGVKEILG